MKCVIGTAAVAATWAFAGGALLTQTVIVPGWRAMTPAVFLSRFAVEGPATGITVFPFEIASAALLLLVARRRVAGRLVWALAAAGMIGSLVLLGYFVPTNLALLRPTFPLRDVPGVLAAWDSWDWVRAGLGLCSAVLASVALSVTRRGHPSCAT